MMPCLRLASILPLLLLLVASLLLVCPLPAWATHSRSQFHESHNRLSDQILSKFPSNLTPAYNLTLPPSLSSLGSCACQDMTRLRPSGSLLTMFVCTDSETSFFLISDSASGKPIAWSIFSFSSIGSFIANITSDDGMRNSDRAVMVAQSGWDGPTYLFDVQFDANARSLTVSQAFAGAPGNSTVLSFTYDCMALFVESNSAGMEGPGSLLVLLRNSTLGLLTVAYVGIVGLNDVSSAQPGFTSVKLIAQLDFDQSAFAQASFDPSGRRVTVAATLETTPANVYDFGSLLDQVQTNTDSAQAKLMSLFKADTSTLNPPFDVPMLEPIAELDALLPLGGAWDLGE